MADFMWLPPLNIHPSIKITIPNKQVDSVIELELSSSISTDHEKLTNPFWVITMDVRVNFCAKTGELPTIMGLNYLSKPIIISFHELINPSTEEAEKIVVTKISEVLSFHSRLFFILSNGRFIKDAHKSSSSSPFEIKVGLGRWIMDFLLRIHRRWGSDGDGSGITHPIPVKIKIREMVKIKNEVYNGWLCWYNSSKKINSEFEKKYMTAISRSRTAQEIAGESLSVNGEQALTAVLKDLKMNSDDTCSICLEKLSEEEKENKGGLKSLECAHIFHGDCIKKWILRDDKVLRYRGACPLCRRRLHSNCTAVLCPLLNVRYI